MRASNTEIEQFLDKLAREAQAGDKLPTIRELMRRFGASQMLVQRAFQDLKDRGLIDSQVGRGTFFLGAGAAAGTPVRSGDEPATSVRHSSPRMPALRSVLLLRRSISIMRGRVLAEGLQRRFSADGHRVLEVSYTDPEHARAVLKGLPRFDACMIQSTFKTITIDLLAAVKDKSEVVAVDGAALVGMDVEAVGTEWGEPLAAAVAMLQQLGHKRIAYASTTQPFLATQLGQRRFETLRNTLTGVELQSIPVPQLPDQDYEAALAELIKSSLDAQGRPPFTALVAWGIENGAKFRALLADVGLELPSGLSVVLLGRTDLPNEHADFFDIIGCSVEDQVNSLYQAITARWTDPSAPYGIRWIPVTGRAGRSTMALSTAAKKPSHR